MTDQVRTEAPTEEERELLHHLLDKGVDDGDSGASAGDSES